MKLRINDTLVTVKVEDGKISATIWAEFSYNVQFDNLRDFLDNIEDQVKFHTEYLDNE